MKAYSWTHHVKDSDLILDDCYAPPVFLLEKRIQQSGLAGAQEASDNLQLTEESKRLPKTDSIENTLARRTISNTYSDRNPVIYERALHIDDILWDRRC